MAAAVIEFNALTDPVGTPSQDHHLSIGIRTGHFIRLSAVDEGSAAVESLKRAFVGGVVIWRRGRKLGGTGVHRLEQRPDAESMPVPSDRQLVAAGAPGDLTVGEAELLDLQQLFCLQLLQLASLQQTLFSLNDASQFGQEPGINAADAMNVRITAASHHGCANGENSFRGWSPQQSVDLTVAQIRLRAVSTPA